MLSLPLSAREDMMRTALADFDSSLRRIRALANHIVANTGAALSDPDVRELHEIQQCGAVVLLTGYFEAFLKDLVRKYIEALSRSGIAFEALPAVIRNRHFEGGGRILTRASEAARKGRSTPFGNATREDIVARLHSASSTDSYQILWEAFADTEANPGPEVVKEIARNLGLTDFWPTVASKSGDTLRWSDTALSTMLEDLIAKRNECAHTGKVSPVPTASEILDFTDLLAAIGTGFVAALEDRLTD
jgi:hypothetical protein